MKTATFLEDFANQCEDKLINFEAKLRQVDTQLKLIEAKLESVPAPVASQGSGPQIVTQATEETSKIEVQVEVKAENPPTEDPKEEKEPEKPTIDGVKAKDDYRYKKYFKMTHFGVPASAVKQKMQAEGMDPDILDHPEQILPDGVIEPIAMDSDSDSD